MRNVHYRFTSQFYSNDDYYIRTEDSLEMLLFNTIYAFGLDQNLVVEFNASVPSSNQGI